MRFASRRLSDMAGRLHLVLPSSIVGDGQCRFTFDFADQPVAADIVRGTVVHLGLDIFEPQAKAEMGVELCDFIERWLLERLLFASSEEEVWEDGVLTEGDWTRLPEFRTASGTFESLLSDNCRTMRWTVGKRLLFSITFPCDYGLISGKDKRELENGFPEEVRNWALFHAGHAVTAVVKAPPDSVSGAGQPASPDTAASQPAFPAQSGGHAPVRLTEDLYFLDGGTFLKESMRARTWWRKTAGGFRLLFDKAFPEETLCNLLSSPEAGGEYTLVYTLRKYGYVSERHSCPLKDMVGRCLASGCIPYVGFSSQCGDRLEAVLIMANAGLGYNHVFKIFFDKNILDSNSGTIRADLNVYVPANNVKEVYHEGQ